MNKLMEIFTYGNGMFLLTLILIVIMFLKHQKVSVIVETISKFIISIMATVALIVSLASTYNQDITKFSSNLGLNLNIIDLGWAPAAIVTWSSIFNLVVLVIMGLINLIMIHFGKTQTLDIDIFDIWHLSFVGLLAIYMGANIFISLVFVIVLGILKLINSDLMKPTFNDLMNDKNSPMTSTHMNYLMNPVVMLLNKICDILFPWLDKVQINSSKFNKAVGFWSSKFATGFFVGIFIGLIGQISMKNTLNLGFQIGAYLEIFNIIGSWLTSSLNPIIQIFTDFLNKKAGKNIHFVGLDWAFLSSRPEVWSTANILAPCLIIEALLLPGNRILPLGGLIAMGITPALLVVTRGRVLRMVVIGVIEIPIFLWSATLSAPLITSMVKNILINKNVNIGLIGSATKEGPIEQLLAIMIGKSSSGDLRWLAFTIISIVIYLLLFYCYQVQMKKRNKTYLEDKI